MDSGPSAAAAKTRVWDPLVRLFHWSLALSFVIAWLSSESTEGLHIWAGYAAAALVAFRCIWGFAGSRYARFSQFVRSPSTVLSYIRAIAAGREARYIGHNPAGGAMIVALLVTMAATAASGWMLNLDAFWGVAWVQHLHNALANGLMVLVLGHLAGVAVASFRHRENLVVAMFSGKKRRGEPDDIV
ncbi:MAG: cytochrome b/b6 domain-containing protein [Ancalomicrobiaceae bacterium]|nr:cytochrome b/b6 domain-containing protein [Ancalomicrobiaceae bacterium]